MAQLGPHVQQVTVMWEGERLSSTSQGSVCPGVHALRMGVLGKLKVLFQKGEWMLGRQNQPEDEELGPTPPWGLKVTVPCERQSLQIRASQLPFLNPALFPQPLGPHSLLVLLPSLLQRLSFFSLSTEGRCSPKLFLGFSSPCICFQMNLCKQSPDCTLS